MIPLRSRLWSPRGATRVKVSSLNALAFLPLFAVAARENLVLALLAGVAGILLAWLAFRLVTRPPQTRLLDAVMAWRNGHPFQVDMTGLPPEYAGLANAIQLATDRLGEREAELRTATEQQALLMQEIHHRVKNNLQIVASMLNLQASRIKVPAAQAEFQSARDRVRALATLHRHLYAHGELQTINLRGFLNELCGQLFNAFGETPGARIDLNVEAPEMQMSSDQAVPLALIVTETVSNSVKFAFPEGRHGTINIHLSAGAGLAELVVEDDGVGMGISKNEPPAAGEGRRDGIGLQLIRGFARQLGGTLKVEDGVGTRYTVRMPIRLDRPVVSSQGVRPAA